jgi:ADP-ribose pyrophosphatase YjhB (NUDIX family)
MCGSRLHDRYVEAEERRRLVCDSCGHIHYLNPKIVAGTLPIQDGKVWILRRAIEPRLGFWTFPAGFMELGETVPEAAARETMEELNLPVEVHSLLGIYSLSHMTTVHIVYMARALAQPSAGREALEIALVSPGEIPWDELAFHSTRQALRDWLDLAERSVP